MKIVRDERLVLQQLKNIRVAFLFQSLCIIAVLVYVAIQEGLMGMMDSPLWGIFLGTLVLMQYLNLRGSVDEYETYHGKKQGPYYRNILISLAAGIIFGGITFFAPEETAKDALLVGGVVFASFLFTFTVVYYMRKRRENEDEEE